VDKIFLGGEMKRTFIINPIGYVKNSRIEPTDDFRAVLYPKWN